MERLCNEGNADVQREIRHGRVKMEEMQKGMDVFECRCVTFSIFPFFLLSGSRTPCLHRLGSETVLKVESETPGGKR